MIAAIHPAELDRLRRALNNGSDAVEFHALLPCPIVKKLLTFLDEEHALALRADA